MAGRNGSGTFTLPSNTWNPAVAGVIIQPDDWNEVAATLVNGLTTSLASDGQTPASARIPFAQGISVAAGSLASPSIAATGDLDTGIYFPAANQMTGGCGGVAAWVATSTSLTLPLVTTFSAAVTFSTSLTVTGAFTANGNVVLGDAAGDALTVNATGTFAGNQTFNGTATFTSTVTVPDASFTNAKLANMATQTIKGRTTAGSGAPEDLSATQATAILNPFTGDSGSGGVKGLVPAPATGDAASRKFLMADGTWVADERKAWARINGTTVTRGRNIASLTNPATGQYVLTFSTALATANYAVLATPYETVTRLFCRLTAQSTTTFTLQFENNAGDADPDGFSVEVLE